MALAWEHAPYQQNAEVADTEIGRYYVHRTRPRAQFFSAKLNGKPFSKARSSWSTIEFAKQSCERHFASMVFDCPLCGQHITDGKPCGCGAR